MKILGVIVKHYAYVYHNYNDSNKFYAIPSGSIQQCTHIIEFYQMSILNIISHLFLFFAS